MPTTFANGENYCNKFNYGHLASISDAFVNQFLTSYLQKTVVNKSEPVWTGGYSLFVPFGNTYEWSWTDDNTFDYKNFENGDDSAYTDQVSITINPSTGTWNSNANSNKYAILCEMYKN
uniref:C-type lectin domain-containing protein n=1 Tax=Acrobeloides nanus TaxID=290746 RepID=A0A914DTB4_9BILA